MCPVTEEVPEEVSDPASATQHEPVPLIPPATPFLPVAPDVRYQSLGLAVTHHRSKELSKTSEDIVATATAFEAYLKGEPTSE